MNTNLSDLSLEQLRRAVALKEQVEALHAELNGVLGAKATPAAATAVVGPARKKGLSAAGRARIAAAQKARWAKLKSQRKAPIAAAQPASTSKPAKRKPQISAAGRARIAAAQKARWAKIRAERAKVKPGRK